MIDVAAALLFRDGRVLITQRRPDDHLGGLWEFPGGKREPGETLADCLRRELREELGLEVQVGEVVERATHSHPDRAVHLEFFRCALLAGEPRPLGCQDLAWVSPDELARYTFPPADARLVDKLLASPELWR
jgi:mutator protein MutT